MARLGNLFEYFMLSTRFLFISSINMLWNSLNRNKHVKMKLFNTQFYFLPGKWKQNELRDAFWIM